MKRIILTKGFSAIVDDEDYIWLSGYKWHVLGQRFYAARRAYNKDGTSKVLYMHREIMKTQKGMQVDHINGNTLDNQKSNLRNCSRQENSYNRISSRGISQYKGVSWNKVAKKWQSYISVRGKNIFLGCYKDMKNAAKAYNEAAEKHHKEFAKLNCI